MSIQENILQGIQQMGLELPMEGVEMLTTYLQLLERWNHVYNLTAVRDPLEMVPRHILDSLSILPWLRGPRVLDVGSGAGLPGIPLAVARPELQFCLLDSNGKRTRFLQHVATQLALSNVSIAHTRIEDFQPVDNFDAITSRALSSLHSMVKWCERLCQPDGILLAMKGAKAEDELAALPSHWVVSIHSLQVPGLASRHHLMSLSRAHCGAH